MEFLQQHNSPFKGRMGCNGHKPASNLPPQLYGKVKQQVTPRPHRSNAAGQSYRRGDPKLFCNLEHVFRSATAEILHYLRPVQVQALSIILINHKLFGHTYINCPVLTLFLSKNVTSCRVKVVG